MNLKKLTLLATLAFSASNAVVAADTDVLTHIEQAWAHSKYEMDGQAQVEAYQQLIKEADAAVAQSPENAELLIWRGIIKSTYAGVERGLDALKYVRSSKEDLERAMAIDDQALSGSAYGSLGLLYLKVPGWPISFGDADKAREYLNKALSINPDGIDPNYFYALFLEDEGEYSEAQRYAQKALTAPPRPGRELADSGRRDETRKLLKELEEEMN